MADRIRLLRFPQPVLDAIQTTILTHWPGGIQGARPYQASYEFKLHGYPWNGIGENSVHSRRLMYRILEALFNCGWILVLSTDVSKKTTDKDSLLFRQQTSAPAPRTWFAISFSRHDRLRFIDAPTEVVQRMLSLLKTETESHKVYDHSGGGTYELKLRGSPWWPDGKNTMEVRRLLLVLLEGLEANGFAVYASIDQKVGGSDSGETDTWHCYKQAG
jgi:hypothetical protein